MRKLYPARLLATLLIILITTVIQAQTIGWNFTGGASPSTTTANIAVTDLTSGNNFGTTTLIGSTSASSGYTGASGGNNAGAASRIGTLNTGSSGSAYFEFTLTPSNGYDFTISAISFGTRRTGTGPQAYTIRSSADNYTTDIVLGNIVENSTWVLKSHTGLTSTYNAATTFRIYGYNGTGSPGMNTANWRIDDLSLSVTASQPTNIATLSSLSISSGILTPAFSANEISYTTSVSNGTTSITVTPVSSASNATIYVNGSQVVSGNASNNISLSVGINAISISVLAADGVTTKVYQIQVTREAPGNPLLFVNPTLFDLGNKCINTTTNASFSINGTDLDGNPISITAPEGFTIATSSNGSYGNTVQLNYTGNTLNPTTIYVKFTPTAVQSYQNSFTILGGGASISYPVNGNGINNTASVNTQLVSTINATSAILSGDITDAGCSNATGYGFEYSTVNNFTNGTGTVVSANDLTNNNFSASVNSLQPNTTYYVKAFVTNGSGTSYGPQQAFTTTAAPVIMAQQAALAYAQNFASIASWTNGFVSGDGANHFGPVVSNAIGNIPNGIRVTTSTTTFASGSSGGVQRGSESLVLLATGAADNTTAIAVDLFLDFTGVNAGTINFDWASINNSTGNRNGSLRIYGSIDGINFTELTGAAVLNITNNTPTNGSINGIALPSSFSNNPNARLRFYYYNGTGGSTGSRPKISIDNLVVRGYTPGDVTAPEVQSYTPTQGATGVTPTGSVSIQFNETVVPGSGNITLHNTTNNTSQTFSITNSAVSVVGQTLTLNTNLLAFKSYYITVDAGALIDLGGNSFAGIAANTWSFTTGAPPTSFNFNDCNTNLPGGFTAYSVTGDAQVWGCTTFGKTGNGVQINGFVSGAQTNEDWLISPGFDLSGFDYPLLSFASRVRFAGPSLKLMVSTNYTGSGDPSLAQWTEVNGRFAEAESDVWTTSDQIDLSAFKAASVYIAFVYTSSPTLNAARWTLDDFNLTNSATPAAPGLDIRGGNIDFDYVANGQTSLLRTFSVEGYNANSAIVLNAPAGFEISLDQNNFSSSITIAADDANTRRNVYARFKPTAADQNYSGQLTAMITNTDVNIQSISFIGTSLRTLKVVNWNLEWFGSTEANLGPTNKNLQQQNVQQVLTNLNADVYALVEIVDTLRFKTVAESLPGNYGYVVNDYGSYATDVNDPDYAGAQKLGFIYNKDVVKKISSRGILRNSTGNAFNSWASGRYPFLMQAEVTLNGATSTVDFIVVHAKANTGSAAEKIEGYERRKAGADELKDTLDASFGNNRIIILGDLNDDFDKTITTEIAPITVSSYSSFLNDATNYQPLTLPLSLTGNSSTVSFPDMIDHVITSSEMSIAYVSNSAKVYRDVLTQINGYASTTSDHFPIITKYDWRFFSKPVINVIDLGLFTNTGTCAATVTLPTPTVTGFNQIVSITSNAPQSFPIGVTKIIWTAVDRYGNTATKEQLITVTDNEKPTIQAPGAVSVANDNGTCGATITSLGTPITADNCGVASVTNNAPTVFPIGTTTVIWTVTDIHGNSTDTAQQLVTVIDNQKPVVVTKTATVSLVNGIATISAADVNDGSYDNCGISTISISKTNFTCTDLGINTITFTVTDIHGNISNGIATVIVNGNPTTASIAVTPSETTFTGGISTNIYLGYGAQSAKLNVTATGGAPYTYSWSGSSGLNNYNSASPIFTPTTAGNYNFTVTVTNANGCATTSTISFCVKDIRVAGSNGKKVYLCHNNQTLELNTNAVDAHLRNHSGDKLGSCAQQGCTITVTNAIVNFSQKLSQEQANTSEGLTVTVLPNPSSHYFTLKLSSKYQAPIQLRITDATGRSLESRTNLHSNSTVQVGHRLYPGTYFAELIQGTERKVVQLIKIK